MKIQILLCLLVCAVLVSSSAAPNGRNTRSLRLLGYFRMRPYYFGGDYLRWRHPYWIPERQTTTTTTTTTAMPDRHTTDMADTSLEWWEDNFNSTNSDNEGFDVFSWLLDSLEIFEHSSNQTERKNGSSNRKSNRQGGKNFRMQNREGGFTQMFRGDGKKGRGGPYSRNSSVEETTPSWCLNYCYNWIGKIRNFEQVFPTLKIPDFFKKKAIKSFCQIASEQLCSANGTMSSNLTVTVDPTGNSTEPISCLSGDDCEMDECCVIGRSGMRCEKLNSLGDTCRYTEDNENVTDVYLFKCPCAGGLECHLNQSQESRSRGEKRTMSKGQCVESNTTTPSPEMTTPDLIEVTPPIPTTCVEHMDCPLSQCCTFSAEGDKSSGLCKDFSAEGATCSTPETFLEFSKVGACPCQAPNQCQTSTGFSSDPTVNGICKP